MTQTHLTTETAETAFDYEGYAVELRNDPGYTEWADIQDALNLAAIQNEQAIAEQVALEVDRRCPICIEDYEAGRRRFEAQPWNNPVRLRLHIETEHADDDRHLEAEPQNDAHEFIHNGMTIAQVGVICDRCGNELEHRIHIRRNHYIAPTDVLGRPDPEQEQPLDLEFLDDLRDEYDIDWKAEQGKSQYGSNDWGSRGLRELPDPIKLEMSHLIDELNKPDLTPKQRAKIAQHLRETVVSWRIQQAQERLAYEQLVAERESLIVLPKEGQARQYRVLDLDGNVIGQRVYRDTLGSVVDISDLPEYR